MCYGGYTGLEIEKYSRKASYKEDSNSYFNISQMVKGGPDQYSYPLILKGDITSKLIQWLKHVREEVQITKFNEVIPIWEFLPNNIQNRDELVKNASKAFYEHKKKVESTLPKSTLIMRDKNEVDVGSRRDAFRGSYWSPVAHNILFKNQDQKNSYLKKHGSQIVNLAISNNAKDGWKNSLSKYLNIETFSASGTLLEPFAKEINPNHNHPFGSGAYNFTYSCMSFKYNSKLDISNDIEIECFANALRFLDSLVERFC